jgi:SAM-dependent methyltransferase
MDLQMKWFDTASAMAGAVGGYLEMMRATDAGIAARERVHGYCVHCQRQCELLVDGGARFGTDVNLREGLVCQTCGLNSRSRELFLAARDIFAPGSRLAVLEAFSPLAAYLQAVWPGARLSEFNGVDSQGGEECEFAAADGTVRRALHQDLQALSFEDESLDGIIHNDVLEHVPNAALALQECRRVLAPGGIALFTMPWFPWLSSSLVRGRLDERGELTEYLPTELHFDGLRPEGIYTFHNFGADFGDLLQRAGFAQFQFGMCYAPTAGFTTNNYRYGDEFLMLPTVIRATR